MKKRILTTTLLLALAFNAYATDVADATVTDTTFAELQTAITMGVDLTITGDEITATSDIGTLGLGMSLKGDTTTGTTIDGDGYAGIYVNGNTFNVSDITFSGFSGEIDSNYASVISATTGYLELTDCNFYSNTSSDRGVLTSGQNGVITINGSANFLNNTNTSSGNYYAGAISSTGDLYLQASTGDIVFAGNLEGTSLVAIAMHSKSTYFNAYGDNEIILYDAIEKSHSTNSTGVLYINSGDKYSSDTSTYGVADGTITFYNSVTPYGVEVSGGTIVLGNYVYDESSPLTVDGIEVTNITASSVGSISVTTFTVADGATVRMENGTSISATTMSFASGSTLIYDIDLTSTTIVAGCIDATDSTFDFEGALILDFNLDSTDDFEDIIGSYTLVTGSTAFDDLTNISILIDGEDIVTDWDYDFNTTSGVINITSISVAVPEPSTYAMIFGALALGLAMYRRRK